MQVEQFLRNCVHVKPQWGLMLDSVCQKAPGEIALEFVANQIDSLGEPTELWLI